MKFQFLICICFVTLASCHSDTTVSNTYFDVDSLIDNQIKYLIRSKAAITKSAMVDTVRDESTFIPTEEGWSNELAAFRQLDLINKPIYADAYNKLDDEKDLNSNLIVRSLVAMKNAPVRQFRIYYQSDPQQIRKIEARVIEQNTLYYTSRSFSIDFENDRGKLAISHYQLQGVQKMILRDSVKFSISSSVRY